MTTIGEMLKSNDPTLRQELRRMARDNDEQPSKNRDDYEQRLKDIVQYCIAGKTAKQICDQFAYKHGGAAGALRRLVKEGKLIREKRTYVAVLTRQLTDPELVARGLPTQNDKYLERLEAEARVFVWDYPSVDVAMIKLFVQSSKDLMKGASDGADNNRTN